MKNKHLYIGLDVHKNANEVALAYPGRNGEIILYGRISNDLHAIDRLITKLRKNHPQTKLHFVYEAGPCGFVIYRYLERKRKDIDCIVVAPSRIPKKSGDKVKTDRRDAMMLAKLHRAENWRLSTFPIQKMKQSVTCAVPEPTQGRTCRPPASGSKPFYLETDTSIL